MKFKIPLPSVDFVISMVVLSLIVSLIAGAWDMDRQVVSSTKHNDNEVYRVEVQETPALFRRIFDSEKRVVYYRQATATPVRRSMFIQFPEFRGSSGDKYRWFDERGHEVGYAPFAWNLEEEHRSYWLLFKK